MSDAQAARDLAILVDVAQQLGATFELMPLLETIERAGRAALNCDRASIFLYEPAADELYSAVATGVSEIRFSTARGIAGEAARSRRVIHVPDAYADPRFNCEIDRQTGYRTRNLLSLPLVSPAGELMGVLQVLNKLSGAFTDNDLVLAGALGALTGTAIKRQMLLDEAAVKQRMERDLSIARQIQQQLLPAGDPQVAGYDIAGWNQPADETGGDFYDFQLLPDGRLAFMIADATGHGIGPALIVAQYRAMLRALAPVMGDLRQATCAINALLCEDLPDDRFITACCGAVEPRDHQLDYVSAGHGPILLYRRETGAVEELPATGLPLGILPDAEIGPGPAISIAAGDIFILLTDGFMEWSRGDGELYGQQRLAELVRRCRDLSCAELIQELYRDVLRFAAGAPQQDDLTAILIKRSLKV